LETSYDERLNQHSDLPKETGTPATAAVGGQITGFNQSRDAVGALGQEAVEPEDEVNPPEGLVAVVIQRVRLDATDCLGVAVEQVPLRGPDKDAVK
jgi:hypothetical protein